MGTFVENVNKLATDLTTTNIENISTVVANQGDIATVATNITDVVTVADNIVNINSVAANELNINTVASDSVNIGIVADNIADIDAVATQIVPNLAEILLADDSAVIATTQAGIATTKASEASSSATAAALSASEAATLLDMFDDRYLGVKDIDPLVDNDGNPLLVGALYFNNVANKMRVWDGLLWADSLTLTAGSISVLTNKTIDDISNKVGADHIHYPVRNGSGSTLVAGTVVRAASTQPGTDYIVVLPVTDPQTQIALGILHSTIANNGTGLCMNTGVSADQVDTSGWTVGTILYPNSTGGLTSTKPTSGRYQACAVVLRSHANHGTLLCEFTEPKPIASTTQSGYVQLNNTLTSTSTTQALTAAQGKVLNDRLVTVENGTVQEGDSVTLTGDVTGTAVFDADGNVNITTVVVDDSHNHIIANVDGLQGALDGKQPIDTTLTALAGVATSADKYIYATGSDTFTTGTITSFGRSLVDDVDASTARGTLGLGSIATQNANTINITGGSISGITDLAIADGGTGASDAANARTNLGISATNTPFTPAGNITATNVQAAVQELDSEKAPLESPALTGIPTAPTAAVGTNTTQVATTEFVQSEIANDTFSKTELAMAIGNINSPLLDMPLKDGIEIEKGVGTSTFTRASTATYIDRYGVLKTADIDEPRFEKKGYLNEGASTNLVTYSDDFSQAVWPKARVTVSSNVATDPFGTTFADKLIEDTTLNTHLLYRDVTVAAGTYTYSCFVKASELTTGAIVLYNTTDGYTYNYFDLTSGICNGGTIDKLSDGWYRVSVTKTVTATIASCRIYLTEAYLGTTSYQGDGVSGLYIFGAQLEALPFATSYIPTTSSTVTRSADMLSVTNIGNVPNTNTSNPQMTVIVDFDSLGLTHTASGVLMSQYATASNYWYIRRYTVDTRIGVISESGDVTSYNFVAGSNNIMTKRRVAAVFNGTTLNFYSNGVLISTQTMATPLLTDSLLDKLLYIGSFMGSNYLYGHISNVRIWDKALTAQEVALA